MNVSSKELTLADISLLQWGLTFAVTPRALPVEDIVVATEEAYRQVGEDKEASLHNEVATVVKKAKSPILT